MLACMAQKDSQVTGRRKISKKGARRFSGGFFSPISVVIKANISLCKLQNREAQGYVLLSKKFRDKLKAVVTYLFERILPQQQCENNSFKNFAWKMWSLKNKRLWFRLHFSISGLSCI